MRTACEVVPSSPITIPDFTVAPPVVLTPNDPPYHQSLSQDPFSSPSHGTTLHKASSFTGNSTLAPNGFNGDQGFGGTAPARHEDPRRRAYTGRFGACGWVGAGLTRKKIIIGKWSQNCPIIVLIYWGSIPCGFFCIYTLLIVVSQFDFSVLSMCDGFPKKVWIEQRVGGVSYIHFF